jgi:hypothetical protein
VHGKIPVHSLSFSSQKVVPQPIKREETTIPEEIYHTCISALIKLCSEKNLQFQPSVVHIDFEKAVMIVISQLLPDSTHHFFRNACIKSGSLRFHSFAVVDCFVCLYNYEFWLSLCSEFGSVRIFFVSFKALKI